MSFFSAFSLSCWMLPFFSLPHYLWRELVVVRSALPVQSAPMDVQGHWRQRLPSRVHHLVLGLWGARHLPRVASRLYVCSYRLTQYADFLLLVSGLWNQQTPLWRYLVQSGHKTLLFAGVNTDQW